MTLTRRDFVCTAAGVAAVGLGGCAAGMGQVEARRQIVRRGKRGPLVIASGNGERACNQAMELIRQGRDPLEAVVTGINIVEDDPNDHSVGYGGLPNEDGVVELDSCVMDGPTHKAGAVAGLRNIRNPSSVALQVMRRTDHVLLVGEGALRFAKAHGFKEQELLTDEAREIWLRWKESHSDADDWLSLESEPEATRREGVKELEYTYGTITCMALTESGDLAGCTSTSGLSYKIPGRVGDSPIIGAGLYVDNDVGACGSTGRGEANLQNCSCFMIVEFMRQGMTPDEACLAMLKRVADKTEPRLRDQDGKPNYGLTFYAVRKDNLIGGAAMWGQAHMTVRDSTECGQIKLPSLCGVRPEQNNKQRKPQRKS
jgi:N4-(beta-N-acetylglucosaminyl)-L-asparaginase